MCNDKKYNLLYTNLLSRGVKTMDKKDKIIILLIVLIAIIGCVCSYFLLFADSNNEPISVGETYEIYNSQPQSMTSFLKDKGSFDMDYDQGTLNWLKELGDSKVVFMTESEFIIMNRSDANKLNIMSSADYSNDLAWKNTVNLLEIKCDVLEIRSLGSGLKDCVLVDNVEAVGNSSREWLSEEAINSTL